MLKLLMFLSFGLCIQECNAQNATGTVIRKLEQQVVQAIQEADTNTLKTLWAPEFIVNTPRNDIAKGRPLFF